jgi:hypothetical protein
MRSMLREIAAYALLTLLAVCVLAAGATAAIVVDGPLAVVAGLTAAAGCAQLLRRPIGRGVGALIDPR